MRRRKPYQPAAKPTPLGDAIKTYVRGAGIKRRLDQASVIPEWAELVGAKIAEVATPVIVREDGVLVVAVRSSAWMQELQLHSPEILRKLGERGKKIRRIAWRDEGQETRAQGEGRRAT